MRDFAISENQRVQAQLDRLGVLSLPQGRLGLDTVRDICARLGDPQRRLPPVFHVAGTNGKGSTCAYLRAILEAQSFVVHTATKPHLVRYNERIRVAGHLISDDSLADLLERVLDASEDLGPSFFEVTTVATFLAFAETPADACVIETGLGGRLDATNVLENPAVCGIATLGIDHEAFLLVPEAGTPEEPLARIAFEKASIAKPGAPLVVQSYAASPLTSVLATAAQIGAPVHLRGRDWWADVDETIHYRDAKGTLELPLPTLAGAHQEAVHHRRFVVGHVADGKHAAGNQFYARQQHVHHQAVQAAVGGELAQLAQDRQNVHTDVVVQKVDAPLPVDAQLKRVE